MHESLHVRVYQSVWIRFLSGMTVDELVQVSARLKKTDIARLALRCIDRHRKVEGESFREAAVRLCDSIGFTIEGLEFWMRCSRTPPLRDLDTHFYELSAESRLRMQQRAAARYRSTGEDYFFDLAEWIANRNGLPSISEESWGPYRDGETGPGND